MKKKNFAFFLLFTVVLISCKPLVIDVNDDYVGYWVASNGNAYYEININPSSQATYEKVSGISTVTSQGKARLKGDKLKIGLKKFIVDQHPTLVDNVYQMQLDGILFTRY